MSAAPEDDARGDAAPAEAPAPRKHEEAAKPRPKRRWWWRWTRRLVLTAVVARVLLWLFLEHLADFGAGFAGLSVSWRDASLSLTGLSLHIQDLVVRDRADGDAPPLLTAHDVHVDVAAAKLLGGDVEVVDVSLAGAQVTVQQNADGTLRLPAAWMEPAAAAPADEPPPADDAPLTFDLPVAIASTRLHDVRLQFVDHRTQPATVHEGTLDLDVRDVGYADRPGDVLLRVHAPTLCDELYLKANVRAGGAAATAALTGAARGFRPHAFALPAEFYEATDDAHVVDVRVAADLDATVEELEGGATVPAVTAKLDLGVSLDGVERSTLTASLGPARVGGDRVDTPFAFAFHADGLIGELALDDGELVAGADGTSVSARLRADDATLRRTRSLLSAAGLALPANGVDFEAALDATLGDAITFELTGLQVRSDDAELLALPRVAVRGLRAAAGAIAVDEVTVVGPELAITAEADGGLVVAGLRTVPPTAAATAPAPAPAPAPAAPDAALPKIQVGSFSWTGARIVYTDAARAPDAPLVVEALEVTAEALTFGAEAPPSRIALSFAVPDVARSSSAEVEVRPRADGFGADLTWRTEGLTLARLAPWLTPAGITSELKDGALSLSAGAEMTTGDDGLHLDARLGELALTDGDARWLALASLRGEGVHLHDGEVEAGTWTVNGPFARVHRDADGALHALGLRIAAAPASAAPSAVPSAAPGAAPTAPQPAARAPRRLPNTDEPLLRHGPLTLDGLAVEWSDARYPDRVFTIGLDAGLGANDGGGEPLPVRAALRLDRAVRSFEVDGTLRLTPAETSLEGALTAAGMRGDELALLLPDGIACTLEDGALAARFAATTATSAEGASSLLATLTGLQLRDGDAELAAVDDVTVDLPALGDELVHVRALRVTGVRAAVEKTDDALVVPGFRLANAAPPAARGPAPGAPGEDDEARAPTPSTPPGAVPPLRVDALELALERFVFHDRTVADAEPLVLTAGLRLVEPWQGDPTDEEPTAMKLRADADVAPLGGKLGADVTIVPFDLAPTVDVVWTLEGLDTTRLKSVAPSLADAVRGEATALTAGATVHARLDLRRRDAGRFDLSRPFGAELVMERFTLRDAATDRAYLTVRAVDIVARAIDPRTGSVLLRSLDVDEPVLVVDRQADGLHVAGFVLPPGDRAAGGGSTGSAPRGQDPAPPATEIAVDRLRVLGLKVDYRDATTTPPTHLALADTDLELQAFTTRALTEPRPFAFTAAVRGGDVELEERIIKSSVLSGFLSSSAEALVGGADEHTMEQRPMLDQALVTGSLQLHPRPKGRVEVRVDQLELAAFRGLAKEGGVSLDDGLFDLRLVANLRGYDGLDLDMDPVFTWLSLSEPPDGPISTYLRLPASLSTVLFLLRNDEDEQRLPMNLHVPADGVNVADVTDKVVETLVKLIGEAVGSAGTRILSTGTGLLLGTDAEVPDVAAAIAFAPGSPQPEAVPLDELLDAIDGREDLTVVLSHAMGAGDEPHAHALANPPKALVQEAVTRLRRSRRDLEAMRAPLARELAALYAAARAQDARRVQRELDELDEHLGDQLVALEDALDQLAASNPRRARRRTREAARVLGEARMEAVRSRILAERPALGADRVELRPARGVAVDGLERGGRVMVAIRRRTAASER